MKTPVAVQSQALELVRESWKRLRYGMFIHFGINTFDGRGWGDGKSPPERFRPEQLDCRQWADVAAEAGMRYAVLTTKHHDGFCLWPTRHTEYCVRNASVRRDVVGEFVEAFRAVGIQPGFYYSLWDRNCPFYDNDSAYAEFMQSQVTELLGEYGPAVEMWFDGGWDKDHPSREWPFDPAWRESADPELLRGSRWRWRELYTLIHQLQPDCLVINNSSSDRPGVVRYMPVDIRTSEHFDFVYRDRVHPLTTPPANDPAAALPVEFCTSLNPDWFWVKQHAYTHPSALTIASWFTRAQAAGGNLLLNVGPNDQGLIPNCHRRFLRGAAQILQNENLTSLLQIEPISAATQPNS